MVRVSRYSSIESRSDERVVVVCVKGRKEEANGFRRRSECRRLIFTLDLGPRGTYNLSHDDTTQRTRKSSLGRNSEFFTFLANSVTFTAYQENRNSVCWKTELRKVGERMRNYWNFNVRNSIEKRSCFAWHGESFAPFAVWMVYIANIFVTKR